MTTRTFPVSAARSIRQTMTWPALSRRLALGLLLTLLAAGLGGTPAHSQGTATLGSSPNPSVVGQAVTFAVTTTALTAPVGPATFRDGTTTLGTANFSTIKLNGSDSYYSRATFTTSTLTAGTHSISVTYYTTPFKILGPTTVKLTQTVGMGTSTSLTSSVTASALGQSVTLTATVTPASGGGSPTGVVTFKDGTTTLGTGTLAAVTAGGATTYRATLATSALGANAHALTAAYSGDGTFGPSTGSLTLNVIGIDATITLKSNSGTSVFGQPVTFTATVAPASGSGTPTGTVTFTVGGTSALGSVVLSGGKATLTTANLGVGSPAVTASYGGDNTFDAAVTSPLTQIVTQSGTTTVVASPASPFAGPGVPLTATVAPVSPGAGTPTGTVTFTIDGAAQTPVALAGGKATYVPSALSVGTHAITAAYAGDLNFTASASATLTQTIDPSLSTTVLASSANPSIIGQAVSITATVLPGTGGSGTPTGSVTFSVDGTAQTPVALAGGQATFSTSALGAGDHVITGSYSGDVNFTAGAAVTLTQHVLSVQNTLVVTGSADDDGSVAPDALGRVPTLRDAVTYADTLAASNPGAVIGITFDPAAFAAPQTIHLTHGQLTLSANAVIQGPAAGVAVDSNLASRGLHITAGTVSLSGLTFQHCACGVMVEGGATAALTRCVLTGNTSDGAGGLGDSGTATLTDCTITNNYAYGGDGGGLSNGGTLTLTRCTVAGNSANTFGGGLASWGTLTLTNCTFANNVSNDLGGAIFNQGPATLTGCTFTGNSAAGGVSVNGVNFYGGGALFNNMPSPMLTDCILYGDSGGEIVSPYGGTITATFCDIQGGYAGTGNISADPLLSGLADNGGPTQTMALRAGSPCLGAGTPVSGLATDQRGVLRTNPPDIGAFEATVGIASTARTAVSLSVGSDGYTRALWDNADGTADVWLMTPGGQYAGAQRYGPYAGWMAKMVSTGTDNQTRLLWTSTDGTANLWLLDPYNRVVTYQAYGPYQGWACKGVAAAPDGGLRALWVNTDGTAALWTLDAQNRAVSQRQYGPFPGWTPKSLSVGLDGVERLLWTNGDGTAAFWRLSADNVALDQQQYGPFPGWTATALVGAPGGAHAVWAYTDGRVALWNLDAQGRAVSQRQYGPFAGWGLQALAAAPDGTERLLWDNADGTAAFWRTDQQGVFIDQQNYGPY